MVIKKSFGWTEAIERTGDVITPGGVTYQRTHSWMSSRGDIVDVSTTESGYVGVLVYNHRTKKWYWTPTLHNTTQAALRDAKKVMKNLR